MKWKLLLYCTKAKPTLYNVLGKFITTKYMGKDFKQDGLTHPELNDKIVAECDFEISIHNWYNDYSLFEKLYYQENMIFNNENSCMSSRELVSYLGNNNLKKDFYAIHVKNLRIFDEPMELNNFLYEDDTDGHYGVWEVERTPADYAIIATDVKDIGGVYCCRGTYGRFLALSSRELCDILNGKKTIVVRKKVLKEMLV